MSLSDANARKLAAAILNAGGGDVAAAAAAQPATAAATQAAGMNPAANGMRQGGQKPRGVAHRAAPRSFDDLIAQYMEVIRRCFQEAAQDQAQCKKVSSKASRIGE